MKRILIVLFAFTVAATAALTGCRPMDNFAPVAPSATPTLPLPTATYTPAVLCDGVTVVNYGYWFSFTNNAVGNSNGFVMSGGVTSLTFTAAASCDYGLWWGFIPNSWNTGTLSWNAKPFRGYTGGLRFKASDPGARTFAIKIYAQADGSSTVYTEWKAEFTAPAAQAQVDVPFSTFTNTTGAEPLADALYNGYGLLFGITACGQSGTLELDDITVY